IQDLATAPIDSKLRPILAFVKKLTLTSTRMTQADADAVFAVGWDEAALHSAIAVCCLFNFMNRLVDGHGIEADRASFAERGRKHVEMGYVAQYEAAVAKNIRRPERGHPLGLLRARPYHRQFPRARRLHPSAVAFDGAPDVRQSIFHPGAV